MRYSTNISNTLFQFNEKLWYDIEQLDLDNQLRNVCLTKCGNYKKSKDLDEKKNIISIPSPTC